MQQSERQIKVYIAHYIDPLTEMSMRTVCRTLPAGAVLEYIRLYEAVYNRTIAMTLAGQRRTNLATSNWSEMRTLVLGLDHAVTWLNEKLPDPDCSPESFEWHFAHFRPFPINELVEETESLPTITKMVAHELLYGIATALIWKAQDGAEDCLVYLECCGRTYCCF